MNTRREGATAPEGVSVEDILRRMREGVNQDFEIRMRAQVFQVRILSLDEVNQIRRFAISETAKNNGDAVDRNVEMQKATLKMASTLTKGGGPGIPDKLLSLMSTDETNDLYEQYIVVVESANPSLETLKPEEFRLLVDGLKKNLLTSRDCSLKQLRAICTAFVDLIQRQEPQKSPPDNSSGGPQSE